MKKFKHAEEINGVITFITDIGYDEVPTTELLDYIESRGYNLKKEYDGNNSPNGDRDPAYDIEIERAQDPEEYLDVNWEWITEEFWNKRFKI